MKINLKKRTRRLETISKRDILIFFDRDEKVREVDIMGCALYTERKGENKDKNSVVKPEDFPFKIEYVAYGRIQKISPNSEGHVYDWKKMRKAI